jgi:hypothetical protein
MPYRLVPVERNSVDLFFEDLERLHDGREWQRRAEKHDTHIAVIPLQSDQALWRGQEAQASGMCRRIMRPAGGL